jgi:Flp pilus assembly pilin Flp
MTSVAMCKRLWRDEEGQDLTEYALLLAFVSLTTAALVIGPANGINFIWTTGNNELSTAASAVTSR